VVREGENFRVLPLSRVRYITADGHNVNLHTAEGTYSMRRGMTALEAQLDPEQFIRVHRSTIVNLDAVRRIRPWFAGDCLLDLDDGTELRLSRNYRERLARFSLNES
jgi:two-component system LytT family response regulator